MDPDDLESQIQDVIAWMRLMGEAAGIEPGDASSAAVRCSECGITVEVPFEEMESLAIAMREHYDRCPMKP